VRPDLKLGNLADQSWNEIFNSPRMQIIRQNVFECKQNCWMVGSAKTAMRHPRFAKIPKGDPMMWVILNKMRVTFGKQIPYDRYVDYSTIYCDENIPLRPSFLGKTVKRKIETKDYHYEETYFNV
jgi:hypothetical protein